MAGTAPDPSVTRTVSTTVYETRKIVDAAFRRCRVVPQAITAEKIDNALDQLYLMLSSLPARTYPLWAQDKVLVAIQEGRSGIRMPEGTIDVMHVAHRTIQRHEGAYVSSAGGNADMAGDGQFETSCVQTLENGVMTLILEDTNTPIHAFGIALDAPDLECVELTLVFETSDNDIDWIPRYKPGRVLYAHKQLRWFEIDPAITANYARVRCIGTGDIMSVNEFFVGHTPREIPLQRINHDTYMAQPDPLRRAKPVQYWVDRQHDVPSLHVWPVGDSNERFNQLAVWRQRHLMDVGKMTGLIEVPQRWYEAIVAGLAWRIAMDNPDIDIGLVSMLKGVADEAWQIVASDERDSAPMTFQMTGLRRYTR